MAYDGTSLDGITTLTGLVMEITNKNSQKTPEDFAKKFENYRMAIESQITIIKLL